MCSSAMCEAVEAVQRRLLRVYGARGKMRVDRVEAVLLLYKRPICRDID